MFIGHTLFACVLVAGCTTAPEQQPTSNSPYAGEETRTIKALSPQEMEGYLSGAGLGFARAAELNSYPGPRHVLELADDLNLTDEQRAQTQAFFEQMQQEAIRLGEQVVAKERALDALFAEKSADPKTMRLVLQQLSGLRAELRFTHLDAHLQVKAILTDEQTHHYDKLRGYTADAPAERHDQAQHGSS